MKTCMTMASLFVSCIAGVVGNACSQDLASGLPPVIETTPTKGVLPPRSRTVLGLTVGKHTLADVKKHLGEATVVKMGKTEGRPNSICYRSNKSDDDTVVLFEAGPLGGFEKLTVVTVATVPDIGSAYQDCVRNDKVSRSSAAAGTLKLGGDIEIVRKSLKAASIGTTKAGLVELPFEISAKTRDKASGKVVEIDTSSGVVARTDQRGVRWFSIYYIESL